MRDDKAIIEKLTLEEKISMIHASGFFCTAAVERLGIPGLRMSDGPSGVRQEFENDSWTPIADTADFVSWLPSNTCLASTWNPQLAYRFGQVLGSEARGRGKDIILAPGINIKRTPLCGRNFEYFSEDPLLTGQMAAPLIQGIQEQDVAACVKHFALNNQEWDRMSVDVEVDDKTLHELYLPAFYEAVTTGGSLTIMGAYNRYGNDFCCENEKLLQTILRDQWHYDGVTISDWGGVHHTEQTALHGVDLEMSVTPDFDEYKLADPLYKKIKQGEIPESVLDERIARILALMDSLRIQNPQRKSGCYNTGEHHKVAEEIAAEGIVLLKNDTRHLPLRQHGGEKNQTYRILVVGDNATRTHACGGGSAETKALYDISPMLGIRMVLGGNADCTWMPGYYVDNEDHVLGEVDWQADSLSVDYTSAENSELYEKTILPKRQQYLREVLEAVPGYDEVIFIGGLNHAFDVEGFDRRDMKLPYGQDDVICALADATENLTVVLINGSPVEMPWIDQVHSLVQTSYSGMNGGYALAQVLFGIINPSGRLPETYPRSLADTPTENYHSYPGEIQSDGHRHVVYKEKQMVGYRYYTTKEIPVLFPFGYGLSYTTFTCYDFHTELCEARDQEDLEVTVSCTIENTGEREGKETLQLYLGIPEEEQPKMALRAFAKTSLRPGEQKKVSLVLHPRDFATYSLEEACFTAKPGTYHIYAGVSAENILYHTTVELNGEYHCRTGNESYTGR